MDRVKRPEVKRLDLGSLRSQLAIDADELDTCLMEQPDLYYHVAESVAQAIAERDAAKLNLEQVSAELDKQFRDSALENEEKVTEASLQRKLAATPRIQALEKELLEIRAASDRWQALKEAFQQRSFMLRELVSLRIANMNNLNLERTVTGAQRDLAEANHAAAGRLRQQRREGR